MRGLVLQGGGVKGSYQIGAYYAFLNCGIEFDGYAGTSIGSFNSCMLAEGKYRELLDFWYNVNPGELLGFNHNLVDSVNEEEYDVEYLLGLFETAKGIIRNFGIDNTNLMNEIAKMISYDNLIKSHKDFGLVTVKVTKNGFFPVYILKGDIHSQQELLDSLMASSFLPVFKGKKLIDDNYYIDGGFYDNTPIKMLTDIGYDEIYVVNIKGIGINRKIPQNVKITTIKPSRFNGKILELDQKVIRDNIKMGYYDTLRVLKKLDGYKYCFNRKDIKYYNFISRKISKKLKTRVMNFFNTCDIKETIIKSLEYILEKEQISYYELYNVRKVVKKIKRMDNKHFVYRFIKEIKFIFP